jgi:hypothetical protein
MNDFRKAIRLSFETDPKPQLHWYYVPFEEDGAFTGALILEATDEIAAVMATIGIEDHHGSVRVKDRIEIPPDRVPAESYRNRWLSKAEVCTIWPDI